MIELRKYKTQLKFVPTQRDKDGLALSSRNMRLNKTQRKLAPFLYKSLNIIKDKLNVTDFNILKNKELVKLKSKGFQIDYLELADLKTLALLHTKKASPAVLLIAAYVDDIRLIDNIVIR
jgi:pantoate--beta-alanine ligase